MIQFFESLFDAAFNTTDTIGAETFEELNHALT
jgi:hypothetical protein